MRHAVLICICTSSLAEIACLRTFLVARCRMASRMVALMGIKIPQDNLAQFLRNTVWDNQISPFLVSGMQHSFARSRGLVSEGLLTRSVPRVGCGSLRHASSCARISCENISSVHRTPASCPLVSQMEITYSPPSKTCLELMRSFRVRSTVLSHGREVRMR